MNWFSELKRRGVAQVGAAYIVTSWLLLQVADVLFPVFGIPDWVMRAMVLLLSIGFPISIGISWFFDFTRQGVRRAADLPEGQPVERAGSGPINILIMGVLSAAVILFALDKFLWDHDLMPDADGKPSAIAVLPFENMTSDPGNDAIAAGIHDDLLTQLSKISAFNTLSRTSMLRFAGTTLPIPDIAGEVGADVVLEGGVQRAKDRLRINVQLIDGDNDVHLWAETYDRQMTAENIFAIQSEIARAIASELQATLSSDEQERLDFVPTESLEAYEAYAAGLASMNRLGVEDYDRAVAQFLRATEIDPRFASAWAGLCRAELSRYTKSSNTEQFRSAEAACQNALELDDGRVEVHIALGSLYRHFGQYARAEVALERANYVKAEQSLEKALSMNAMTVDAKVELAYVLMRQDRMEEAGQHLLEAERINPKSYEVVNGYFSLFYHYGTTADRFDKAASYAAKMTSLRPDLPASWNNLGSAHYMRNHYDDAAEAWQESLALKPTRTGYSNTGLAYYYSARFEEAVEMQRNAVSIAPDDHRAWGRLADALSHLDGGSEESREAYARAIELAAQNLEVNSKNWRTRGMYASYLAHTGQYSEAEQNASKSILDGDRRAETLIYAAIVKTHSNQHDEALGLLEEAIERDENYRHLIATEPDFWPLADTERFRAMVSELGGSTVAVDA